MTEVADRTIPADGAAVARPVSLWRNWDFNKLWVGQTVSMLGSEITSLALPLTAILVLDASTAQIGVLGAFQSASTLALMFFAGVIVDSMRRKTLMIVTDLARAGFLALVPILAAFDALDISVLYAVAFFTGGLTLLFGIAYSAYVPSLLDGEELIAGNSRLQASEAASGIFGATLGGLLVTLVRAVNAVAIDAGSFVFSALMLRAIRKPETHLERRAQWNGLRQLGREIVSGIRPNYRNPYLRALSLNAAGTNFASQIVLTLFILYAARDLHLSPTAIGVIFSAGGAGGLAAAMTMGRLASRFGFGRTFLGAAWIFKLSLAATPLVVGPHVFVVPALVVVWGLSVFGLVIANIAGATLQQTVVPDELRGRIVAAHRLVSMGVLPLGALFAGFCGELLGLRATLGIAAVVLPLTMLPLVLSPIRRLARPSDAAVAEA